MQIVRVLEDLLEEIDLLETVDEVKTLIEEKLEEEYTRLETQGFLDGMSETDEDENNGFH